MTERKPTKNRKALPFVLAWGFRVLFLNFLGFFGVALIAYEIAAAIWGSRWPLLDRVAPFVSSFLTLLGALFVAASIYLYNDKPSPPEKISVYFTGWLTAGACGIAIVFLFQKGTLPTNIVNGFALLAIAGGLLRIQPNPIQDERVFYKKARTGSSET